MSDVFKHSDISSRKTHGQQHWFFHAKFPQSLQPLQALALYFFRFIILKYGCAQGHIVHIHAVFHQLVHRIDWLTCLTLLGIQFLVTQECADGYVLRILGISLAEAVTTLELHNHLASFIINGHCVFKSRRYELFYKFLRAIFNLGTLRHLIEEMVGVKNHSGDLRLFAHLALLCFPWVVKWEECTARCHCLVVDEGIMESVGVHGSLEILSLGVRHPSVADFANPIVYVRKLVIFLFQCLVEHLVFELHVFLLASVFLAKVVVSLRHLLAHRGEYVFRLCFEINSYRLFFWHNH